MLKFGITEAGDAGLDFSWADKLLDGNIIITKHLTTKNTQLLKLLVENQDKIILHATCTGFGGTKMEPNVPKPIEVYEGMQELIRHGFPVNQIVLRTDPTIPTEKGIERVVNVWELFKDSGIKRVRYSIIDMYSHTKERILKEYGKLPFEGFKAPQYMINNLLNAMEPFRNAPYSYSFEACAEDLPDRIGCISKKDYEILGLDTSTIQEGGFQRKTCACCAGKTELLTHKKRCPSGCLYCYWKD